MDRDLEQLKQRLPLLEYLQRHNWKPWRCGNAQEFVGLCPLHRESRPSFYVNAGKNLFYCQGCGRGGDLIRFVQLSSICLPAEYRIPPARACARFRYPICWSRRLLSISCNCSVIPRRTRYLEQRGLHDPATIEELGIGYAAGGNLRRHLAALGLLVRSLVRYRPDQQSGPRRVLPACGLSVPPRRPHRQYLRSQYR